MNITGIMVYYYFICERRLWYFAKHINMEQNCELVLIGKIIDETTYSREKKGILIDNTINIDFINNGAVLHEVKKTKSIEVAGIWQLKYYMYVFEQNGIEGISGILEYPVLRKRDTVLLSDIDRETIVEMINEKKQVIESDFCPPLERKRICRNCSYWDFCYSGEEEE